MVVRPVIVFGFFDRELSNGTREFEAKDILHFAAILDVSFGILRIRRLAEGFSGKHGSRALVDSYKVPNEANIVIGKARRLFDNAGFAHGPKVQTHPHAAFFKVEMATNVTSRALGRIPGRGMCRRTVVNDGSTTPCDGMRR